jgi:hypothetical protein
MAFKLTHPDKPGAEVEARAEDVAMYESQGWETAPTVKSPTEADEKKK